MYLVTKPSNLTDGALCPSYSLFIAWVSAEMIARCSVRSSFANAGSYGPAADAVSIICSDLCGDSKCVTPFLNALVTCVPNAVLVLLPSKRVPYSFPGDPHHNSSCLAV